MTSLNDFLGNKLDLRQMTFFQGGKHYTTRTCMDSTCHQGMQDTFYEVTSDDGTVYLANFTRFHDTECDPVAS